MRRAALVVLILAPVVASGCSPKSYFTDRWRDTKDVLAVSVGTGGGAKARVGPLQVGLFMNSDYAGLRGGGVFYLTDSFGDRVSDMEDAVSPIPIPGTCGTLAADEIFEPGWIYGDDENSDPIAEERGKYFRARSKIPFVIAADRPEYFTQIEVAAGIGGTIRLGLNPGELLDFVVGWSGIDIYGDDLEARKQRKQAKEPRQKPPEVLSTHQGPPPRR